MQLALQQLSAVRAHPPLPQTRGFSWKQGVAQAPGGQECLCVECGYKGGPSIFKAKMQGTWEGPVWSARAVAGSSAGGHDLETRVASGA